MRYSADELYYENVIVLGYGALFTNERIRQDTVPVVYCIIKFPKVAEAIPQSCRGNFPNNAAVFGASLSLLGW